MITGSEQSPEISDEAALLARMAQGDEAAFADFYARLSPQLYGLALRIMNDPKEAEDVLQEGFSIIWRTAATYDPARAGALTWAVMIVRNKAIDKLRVRQRRQRTLDLVTEETAADSDHDRISAQTPELRERAALVRSTLQRIPADQKQALELSYFGGLTQEQIAEQLETPLGTIKARIRRGLLRMRDHLKGGVE